jgi:hypothetical protein
LLRRRQEQRSSCDDYRLDLSRIIVSDVILIFWIASIDKGKDSTVVAIFLIVLHVLMPLARFPSPTDGFPAVFAVSIAQQASCRNLQIAAS